jgi:hypothetical protein
MLSPQHWHFQVVTLKSSPPQTQLLMCALLQMELVPLEPWEDIVQDFHPLNPQPDRFVPTSSGCPHLLECQEGQHSVHFPLAEESRLHSNIS